MITRQPKAKTCKNSECAAKFTPQRLGQAVCSPKCAIAEAKQPANQKRARIAIEQRERREIKVRKEKLKSRSSHEADAEKAVRDYRRTYELSIGSGCISCEKTQAQVQAEQGWKTGGAWDGGHFLGKGARPELRLLPENIWLQCKSCNGGSGKYARKNESVGKAFEAGLIKRIGLEAVEALKADRRPRKHTIEEFKTITAEYRAKLRELKKAQA